MSGDVHVRFCESLRGKLPRATRRVCAFQNKADAERFYQGLPGRLKKFNLEVAPEKTQIIRFSRFHPSMKRRFTFLGFELYWFPDHKGVVRVFRRTARKKLQGACSRIKAKASHGKPLSGQSSD